MKNLFFYLTHFGNKYVKVRACLFEVCRGQISNAHCSIKKTYTYKILLDHLCSFSALGRINNHITGNSIYFEKGSTIVLIHHA